MPERAVVVGVFCTVARAVHRIQSTALPMPTTAPSTNAAAKGASLVRTRPL